MNGTSLVDPTTPTTKGFYGVCPVCSSADWQPGWPWEPVCLTPIGHMELVWPPEDEQPRMRFVVVGCKKIVRDGLPHWWGLVAQ